eukprot:1146809-Pelagomonas_calceolata.AAC.7
MPSVDQAMPDHPSWSIQIRTCRAVPVQRAGRCCELTEKESFCSSSRAVFSANSASPMGMRKRRVGAAAAAACMAAGAPERGSPEHIALGALSETQLVDVDVRAEGDEAHIDVLRQRGDSVQDGLLAGLQLVLGHAGVDEEQVDGRVGLDGPRQRVLDGREAGVQLCGQSSLGDALVVGREVVASDAERTDPHLRRGGEVGGAHR